RDGDKMGFPVFPLQWTDPVTRDVSRGYREDGYFPEAVVNMLALLGWNEGAGSEKEIYTLQELIQVFDLEHVSKSGAKFNPDKTKWFNQQYLQLKSDAELASLFLPVLANEMKLSSDNKLISSAQAPRADLDFVAKVVGLIKERATFVSDFWDLGCYFFIAPTDYDEKAVKKAFKEDTGDLLKEVIAIIENIDDFRYEKVSEIVKSWITAKEIGFGKIMMPLRLSLVGSLQGPDVFEIAALIGKNETIKRIERVLTVL
ncbi:MAG: glutamate--tRNA ligase, partial [Flavobacteriaceae bacterium]|nr:glutamate--tRNA ligase [Flavobacteriaceae bacterium]